MVEAASTGSILYDYNGSQVLECTASGAFFSNIVSYENAGGYIQMWVNTQNSQTYKKDYFETQGAEFYHFCLYGTKEIWSMYDSTNQRTTDVLTLSEENGIESDSNITTTANLTGKLIYGDQIFLSAEKNNAAIRVRRTDSGTSVDTWAMNSDQNNSAKLTVFNNNACIIGGIPSTDLSATVTNYAKFSATTTIFYQTAYFNSGINLSSQPLSNVPTPTASSDGANKYYVDTKTAASVTETLTNLNSRFHEAEFSVSGSSFKAYFVAVKTGSLWKCSLQIPKSIHASANSFLFGTVIPEDYRPQQTMTKQVDIGTEHVKAYISTNGQVSLNYSNNSGSAILRTDTKTPFSVDWIVPEL